MTVYLAVSFGLPTQQRKTEGIFPNREESKSQLQCCGKHARTEESGPSPGRGRGTDNQIQAWLNEISGG